MYVDYVYMYVDYVDVTPSICMGSLERNSKTAKFRILNGLT